MHPVITIFCPFTRRWAVDGWLANLEALPHDPGQTNLAVIVDVDDPYILNTIKRFVEGRGYRKFVFRVNENWTPNEVRIAARRLRIADIKNQSKKLINQCDGDIILSLEDDTVFANLDIGRLINPLLASDRIGFVEGVQCGRWSFKLIGAWRSDDPRDPHHVETLLPPADGYSGSPYESIDGGGWYGYATRRSLYLNCEYYASSAQPWGPDVNYGLWLKRQGYENLIDWNTVFGHNDHGRILYPDSELQKVVVSKNRETGEWVREDGQPV